jgi:N-acyl-L-homoserine lactone synthetase
MEFISGLAQNLTEQFKSQLYKYRYEVFVERLGWEMDTPFHRETDQFDHEDTVYITAHNEKDEIVGCSRLLPTTSPYLLEIVFPQLLNGAQPPKSEDIWELSRFTSLELGNNSPTHNGQFSLEVSVDLLTKSLAYAKQHGAKRIITVSPIGIERLLRRAGFMASRAGAPMIIDGHPLVACWLEIE